MIFNVSSNLLMSLQLLPWRVLLSSSLILLIICIFSANGSHSQSTETANVNLRKATLKKQVSPKKPIEHTEFSVIKPPLKSIFRWDWDFGHREKKSNLATSYVLLTTSMQPNLLTAWTSYLSHTHNLNLTFSWPNHQSHASSSVSTVYSSQNISVSVT